MLRCETNTIEVKNEVTNLAVEYGRMVGAGLVDPFYERGRWWVRFWGDNLTIANNDGEAVMSVVDTMRGLELEEL